MKDRNKDRDTPVKGKIIMIDGLFGKEESAYQCSMCDAKFPQRFNYCPNCGQLLDFFEADLIYA